MKDEGTGISKDKMKNLYSRFLDGDYRRKNTTGTGIGLSLTHDLVKLHHGSIDCHSVVEQGTVFTVRIPTDKKQYAKEETEEMNSNDMIGPYVTEIDSTQHRTSGFSHSVNDDHRFKILIVEDNEELLELMQRLLSKKYTTYTAKTGSRRLTLFAARNLTLLYQTS